MAATLKIWTHPTTGAKRIYVSGLIGQNYDDKVWFEQQPVDCFGCDWKICKKIAHVNFETKHIDTRAENLVREPGTKSPMFAEILAMAK